MIRSIPFPSRSMLWQAPAAVSSGVPELRLPWLSRARKKPTDSTTVIVYFGMIATWKI